MNNVTSSPKRVYEKPVIHKLATGLMNKFGTAASHFRKVKREIDGVPISALTEAHGSPLYVFSERTLRGKFREIKQAFSSRYPNVTMGWSYKTNYLQAICAVLHDEGAHAELVSAMEYEKALSMGIPGHKTIFNGPHKPKDVLEKAVREGVAINIDHLDEIEDLEEIAVKLGQRIPVGLRLNMDVGIYPAWSRFGFNLESGQAMEAVERIAKGGKLKVTGLHSHIGTFILEPAAYGRQVEKMVAFGYEVEAKFGFLFDTIDVGGGLPSKSKLKGSYHAAQVTIPPVSQYAEEICNALWRCLKPGHQPRLIVESGRAVVDEAGTLITTVQATKRLADGTRAYVVDGGVNLLFTAFWYKFDIMLGQPVAGVSEHSVVYGPLCMNIDAIDEGMQLPPLSRGDKLVVPCIGAYNNTQWMQFIEYRPNVVMIAMDGTVEVIREAEDLSDLHRREKLPARLVGAGNGSSNAQESRTKLTAVA
jgi:diaminopimelate decarboxylase